MQLTVTDSGAITVATVGAGRDLWLVTVVDVDHYSLECFRLATRRHPTLQLTVTDGGVITVMTA